MATEMQVADEPYAVDSDLSAKQYYIVKQTAVADQVTVCTGTGDIPLGVLQGKPTATQGASVRRLGISKVVAHAAISVGDRVGTHSDGTAVTKTADGDWIIGFALTAAAGAGEIISVALGICQRAG